jgi:hypothetical protein
MVVPTQMLTKNAQRAAQTLPPTALPTEKDDRVSWLGHRTERRRETARRARDGGCQE